MGGRLVLQSRILMQVTVTTVVVLALTVAMAACTMGTSGEGPVASDSREVETFTRVEVDDGIRLVVRIGPAQPVEVKAQANILPIISTEVASGTGTLTVKGTSSFTTSEPTEVTVVTPTLEGITVSGGSRATVDGLSADQFSIGLSGGSVLVATGTATTVTLDASGGSRASLEGLVATDVLVDASGGSNVTVQASGSVSGSSSGGSHVAVRGDATIDVESTGGGSVTQE